MSGRLHHVGSSPDTLPIIVASFARLLPLLERLLGDKRYLFGGRPSLADFGLAAQLGQLLSDPTPGALLREQAPGVVRWVGRMESPQAEGEFLQLEELRDELSELWRAEIAGVYLPWMQANADAVADDAPQLEANIGGQGFVQKPQRYAAKAFAEVRGKVTRDGKPCTDGWAGICYAQREADTSEDLATVLLLARKQQNRG